MTTTENIKEKATITKKKNKSKKPKKHLIPTGEPIKDTTHKLPEQIQKKMIVCKEVGQYKTSQVELDEIKATSKQIYVDNIHHANPTILQTIYWIIAPESRHVVARVTKEQYEYILQNKKNINHHISVVDCAVIPTLTYGSWKASEINGELPSAEQIKEKEEELKKNTAVIHNPPVKIELYKEEEDDTTNDDELFFGEEDFIDFNEED